MCRCRRMDPCDPARAIARRARLSPDRPNTYAEVSSSGSGRSDRYHSNPAASFVGGGQPGAIGQ